MALQEQARVTRMRARVPGGQLWRPGFRWEEKTKTGRSLSACREYTAHSSMRLLAQRFPAGAQWRTGRSRCFPTPNSVESFLWGRVLIRSAAFPVHSFSRKTWEPTTEVALRQRWPALRWLAAGRNLK